MRRFLSSRRRARHVFAWYLVLLVSGASHPFLETRLLAIWPAPPSETRSPQSPEVAKHISELLVTVRQDLREVDRRKLDAEDRRRLDHIKYLVAEVVRIGRDEKLDRDMDALALAEQASAELTIVLVHQLHLEEYCALVDRYRAGDRAAIEIAGRDWPPSRVEPIVAFFTRKISSLGVKEGPLEQIGVKTMLGTAMLETELAIEFPSSRVPTFEVPRRLLALSDDRAVTRGFRQQWYLAVAGHLQGQGQLLQAVHHADDAVATFPDEVDLVVAAGALHELLAAPQLAAPTPTRVRRGGTTVPVPTADLELMAARKRDGLKIAEKFYRHAIAVDPACAEAHLRLGRVLFLSGRPDAAMSELALSGRSTDRRIRYLASMFTGAVRAASNQWADAVAAYRDAGARYPNCLAAAVALSHTLRRSGDLSAASDTMDSALANDRRAPCNDPWWDYPLGPFYQRDRLLDELRRAIR